MKKFEAIKKPIYVAELRTDTNLYPYAIDAVDVFKKKHPEYADCKYNISFEGLTRVILFYRECAEDIVEL